MADHVLATSELISRARRSANNPPEANAYNRSSLAVKLDDGYRGYANSATYPQLVPRVNNRAAAAPVDFAWKGIDLSTFERDRKSNAISFVFHSGVIIFVLWLGLRAHTAIIAPATVTTKVDFTLYAPPPPPKILPVAKVQGGGGGGGAHQIIEPTRGHPPVVVTNMPALAPQILRIDHPKLAAEPAESVKMPDASPLLNVGMSNSPQVALASQEKAAVLDLGPVWAAALARAAELGPVREVVAGTAGAL